MMNDDDDCCCGVSCGDFDDKIIFNLFRDYIPQFYSPYLYQHNIYYYANLYYYRMIGFGGKALLNGLYSSLLSVRILHHVLYKSHLM